ncbi:hypothetical protein Daesc_006058 [Daldinia eschscholtzii]|uniref:Uncharacterized protein n=1 Tax=Daldinia eschscholtzii TaxID=292717 RepID=A0AAX6MGI4_9PEZI
MDFINKITGNKDNEEKKSPEDKQQESSGGFMDKINSMAGGGKESEKNEDVLDKGVDWVQEHVLGQGDQSNESAVEQAKDEQISDYIRDQYKKTTGSDFPVKDKDRF